MVHSILGRFPLYGTKFEEFQPDKKKFCFIVETPSRSVILQASSEEEFYSWINTLLKNKIIMEDAINNISD